MSEHLVIDGRAMVPPEPMEKTLAALDHLPDGEEILLLLRGKPYPLYAVLAANGYAHSTSSAADGTVEIRIRKKT